MTKPTEKHYLAAVEVCAKLCHQNNWGGPPWPEEVKIVAEALADTEEQGKHARYEHVVPPLIDRIAELEAELAKNAGRIIPTPTGTMTVTINGVDYPAVPEVIAGWNAVCAELTALREEVRVLNERLLDRFHIPPVT